MPPKAAPKSARKSARKSAGKSVVKSGKKSAVKSASAKSGSRRKSLKIKAPKKEKQKHPPKKARYETVTKRGKEVEAKLKEIVSADMQKHRQQPHAKLKEFLKKLAPKSKRPVKSKSTKKLAKSVKSSQEKGKREEDEENITMEITTTLPKDEPTKTDAKTSIVPKSRKSIKSIPQPKSAKMTQPPSTEGAPPGSTQPPASENTKNSGSDDAVFEVIKSDVAPLGTAADESNQIATDLPDVPQLHKMIKDIVLSTNKIKQTLQQKKTAKTTKPLNKENLPPDG